MKTTNIIPLSVLVIGLTALLLFYPPESLEQNMTRTAIIPKAVEVPLTNNVAVVTPSGDSLTINGRALATMFLSGSFPVRLENDYNIIIAEGLAEVVGPEKKWAATAMIPFVANLTLINPVTSTMPGTLIFTGENITGREENDMIVNIPALIKIK